MSLASGLHSSQDAGGIVSTGWCIENSGDEAPPDVGEVNNTGDVVETALTLARAAGLPRLYEDVVRAADDPAAVWTAFF